MLPLFCRRSTTTRAGKLSEGSASGQGYEGLVAKDPESSYVPERTLVLHIPRGAWLVHAR